MKGFVLAAGFGQRLSPITKHIPKPLLPVGSMPLIGYALRLLAHHGITDIIVNTHHLAHVLRDALREGSRFGVRLTLSEEATILGTGGGLKQMQHALVDETFVVANSDTLIDVDISAAAAEHRAHNALATLVLRESPSTGEYGAVEVDAHGRVLRILGKGRPGVAAHSYMFAGVHVIEPRLLDYIPAGVESCINRLAYAHALEAGEYLHSVVMDGYWADAGTPSRYYDVNAEALDGKLRFAHADALSGYADLLTKNQTRIIANQTIANEQCRLGHGVTLGRDVKLVGPVLIGDAAVIGDHAVVGPYAIVGASTQIGAHARVSHSIVLDQVTIEANARVNELLISKEAQLSLEA